VKKIIFVAVVLTAVFMFEAGFAQRTEPFVISGVWERKETPREIVLFQVIQGRLEGVSVTLLQDDNSFAMAFAPPTEGFYVVGIGNPNIRADKYTFYFKPGDQLNFVVNDTSYTLVGENTRENIAMTAWHNFIQPLEWASFYGANVPYQTFFTLLEDRLNNPFRATRTGNRKFDELFAKYRKFDFIHCAVNFVQTPFIDLPERVDFPRFFKELDITDFDNTNILIFPYRLLSNILLTQKMLSDDPILENNPNMPLMEILTNDTLKGEIFLGILSVTSELSDLLAVNAKFARYIVTEDQKKRFHQQIERINRQHIERGPGVAGFIPTYQDIHGNDVSADEFKGKVIYIYVWATWCSPCIAQIPDKKKLKKYYADNDDVVIIGISIDAPKDLQKWRDFVVEKNLGGIQVHGNIEGPYNISKLYHVTGVPRFLLFEKKGNIVSLNAPRPGSDEIVALINKLLRE
jgi:thiol-disulfide isomerase/thioredoxin